MRAFILLLPIVILLLCVPQLQTGTVNETTKAVLNRETIVQPTEFRTHHTELPLTNQLEGIAEFCQPPLDSAALDSVIIHYMDTWHTAGLSGSIVKNGQVIWTRAYGYAYVEPPILVTDSTLFMLASISKTVTGTALMQLYEQGEFNLDDPINDYLPFDVIHPNPLYADTNITFSMLLSHTSSIRDNWSAMPYYHGDPPIPLGEYLEDYLTPGGKYYNEYANFAYGYMPGTLFSYCNIAVALVGYLVEVISGQPFDQYCQENIFAPLEMNETAWFLADLDTMHVAMPYHWNGVTYVPYGHYGYNSYPDGQLRTSAPQLLRFLTAFMQHGQYGDVSILDSTTVELMTTPHFPEIDDMQGLIWYSLYIDGRLLWGHGGGDQGVRTRMYYCPNETTGVVVLTNGEYPAPIDEVVVDALFDYAAGGVGIEDSPSTGIDLPKTFALLQNYPNPFNPSTTITFNVPGNSSTKQRMTLAVYDLRGRLVRTLVNSEIEPGTHKVTWNGKDEGGNSVSSGIYLYSLKADGENYTRKMTVLK